MKLCRVGNLGQEIPALIDKDNNFRNLSSIIEDLNSTTINFETLEKIKKVEHNKLSILENNQRIGACVSNPSKYIGIGLNFKDHAIEQNLPIPKEPIIFSKFTNSICGPNDDINIPKNSEHTDWEVELGFVIGKKAKYVNEEDAINYVFGFFLANDLSERNFQKNKGPTWTNWTIYFNY